MLASFGFFELKTDHNEVLIKFLENHPNFGEIKTENGLITAFLNKEMNAGELNNDLFKHGIVLSHLVKRRESLEEQFLTLTENQSI
jgi:ABC-2 type transport system ATP-binding protein